jgi:hypothetical protein
MAQVGKELAKGYRLGTYGGDSAASRRAGFKQGRYRLCEIIEMDRLYALIAFTGDDQEGHGRQHSK